MPYDLVLRSGHVIDPAQGLNETTDVAVQDGKIAGLGAIGSAPSREVIDLKGRYLCPALIDLHGHWYEGSVFGIDADLCLNYGVTTVVDAGTTGYVNFSEFRRHVIERARVRVFAFLNIACLGLPTTVVGELEDLRYARPIETAETVNENRDVVLGVKIR